MASLVFLLKVSDNNVGSDDTIKNVVALLSGITANSAVKQKFSKYT